MIYDGQQSRIWYIPAETMLHKRKSLLSELLKKLEETHHAHAEAERSTKNAAVNRWGWGWGSWDREQGTGIMDWRR